MHFQYAYKEKGTAENEMVGWYHRLNGHDFEQTLGDSEGQRSLACCSPWDHRVVHDLVTEQEGNGHFFTSSEKLSIKRQFIRLS